MIRMCCDRCGKEVEGTYYTIRIYGNDVNKTDEYITTFAAACQNVNTNMMAMLNAEKQYCKTCKDEIEKFISNA